MLVRGQGHKRSLGTASGLIKRTPEYLHIHRGEYNFEWYNINYMIIFIHYTYQIYLHLSFDQKRKVDSLLSLTASENWRIFEAALNK